MKMERVYKNSPEVREKKRKYMLEYNKSPKEIERRKGYSRKQRSQPGHKEKMRKYMREYMRRRNNIKKENFTSKE